MTSLAKVCSRCHTAKPLAEFHRNWKTPDGRAHLCKVCRHAYMHGPATGTILDNLGDQSKPNLQLRTYDHTVVAIALNRGRVALVDRAALPLIAADRWCADRSKCGVWYVQRNQVVPGVTSLIHRVILGAALGPKVFTDHKNGCGLDNRRRNLRPATPSQNSISAWKEPNPKTGYRGVLRWRKGVYRAQIGSPGLPTRRDLGWFADPVEAARAYDRAAIEIYGDFAKLNFPGETHHASGEGA